MRKKNKYNKYSGREKVLVGHFDLLPFEKNRCPAPNDHLKKVQSLRYAILLSQDRRTTMAEDMELQVAPGSINASLIFHVVSDVLAFLLYMHQQIPSYVLFLSICFKFLF